MVENCAFFMSAMVKWVARHHALAAAGPGKPPPPGLPASAIPCVRVMPDHPFLKRLTGSVIFCLFCVQHAFQKDTTTASMDTVISEEQHDAGVGTFQAALRGG
eukprot:jgi/Tetstr1/427961/TSEL_018035.t1